MLRVTKKFFSFLTRNQKLSIFILIFMMLISGIMESLSISLIYPLINAITNSDTWSEPWYAKAICDVFGISQQRQYVQTLLVLLISIFIVKNAYLIFNSYVQYTFIGSCRYRMQSMLIHSYIRKPYEFYLHANFGEIVRIISADTVSTFNLLSNVLLFFTEIIVAIIIGITIFVMSPAMAVGIIVILLVEMTVIAFIIKPVMKRTGIEEREENAAANKWLLQALNGIKSIKVANKEDFFEKNYTIHIKKNVKLTSKFQTLVSLPRLLIEAFTVSGVLILLLVMVLTGSDLIDLVPQLSAFVVAAIRLLPSVNRISTSLNQMPFYEGALDNIIRVIDEKKAVSNYQTNNECSINLANNGNLSKNLSFQGEIDFHNISFQYSQNGKKVLENAQFTIKEGESVGIIGPSGSGKTTTVDIILGLLLPSDGVVLVDGHNIFDNLPDWLSRLAYIPQSIFLMDDSIRANIAFGISDDGVSDAKVWEALEEAQLYEFVKELPDGLDTTVGEQGVRLSGGQRQRIGIARALYNNPEILFFDEATSALDNETETAIMDSINHLKGRKTIVIIAHRLTTIDNCDSIYRVDNGRIEKVK